MSTRDQPAPGTPVTTIYFVSRRTSGEARRMDSLIAHLQTRERKRAVVRRVDVDDAAAASLVGRLGVTDVPAIVVVKDRQIVGRLSGRATMPEIDQLVLPHLEPHDEPAGGSRSEVYEEGGVGTSALGGQRA